jgi:hypothetical protein
VIASIFDALSIALAGAGMIVLALSPAFASRWRSGVPIALELWTGAGLLRLAGEPSWSRVATAALIVCVRRLILVGR